MKYLKNGNIVLDGTIKESDLETRLLKALEIIIDKSVEIGWLRLNQDVDDYNRLVRFATGRLTHQEYELLRGLL